MVICSVKDKEGKVLIQKEGEDELYLVYKAPYREGDVLSLSFTEKGLYEVKLDAAMDSALVWAEGTYTFPIPFGEKKDCYPPVAFSGEKNLVTVRKARKGEEANYRNLAFNPMDWHGNTALWPHSKANVETRGESVFASRNAIDGNFASDLHGKWPYESWGINRDPDATLSIDFGRKVRIDTLILHTRADFPHDAWWTQCTVTFSDGSEEVLKLEKKDGGQVFPIKEREISSFTVSRLIKADDPSPFPALIQIEAWGREGS